MTKLKEIWKSIRGYKGYYLISNFGRIYSIKSDTIIKNILRRTGYEEVGLSKNGKRKKYRVHRLVARTFIGPIRKGYVVNHIDENKANNRVDNLEIVTQKENLRHGTVQRRISDKLSKALILTKISNNESSIYRNASEASCSFGYKKGTIASVICKANKVNKTTICLKGDDYKWEFIA